jgi:hypothetical protein
MMGLPAIIAIIAIAVGASRQAIERQPLYVTRLAFKPLVSICEDAMAFQNCPGVASVELIFDALGQKVENVYHVKQEDAWTETDLTNVAAAFKDWFSVDMAPITHSSVSLGKIVCKDLSTSTGPAIEYVADLPIAGGYSSTAICPLNVTAAVSFGTALRGRSYRGRIYHVGLAVAYVSGNQLGSGTQGSFLSAYGALVTAVSTAGFQLCVLSRFAAKALRTNGIGTAITSVSVDINLDSQRRRLAGRGQ